MLVQSVVLVASLVTHAGLPVDPESAPSRTNHIRARPIASILAGLGAASIGVVATMSAGAVFAGHQLLYVILPPKDDTGMAQPYPNESPSMVVMRRNAQRLVVPIIGVLLAGATVALGVSAAFTTLGLYGLVRE